MAGPEGFQRNDYRRFHRSSATAVAAGLKDLEATPGISGTIARKLYEHFHG